MINGEAKCEVFRLALNRLCVVDLNDILKIIKKFF